MYLCIIFIIIYYYYYEDVYIYYNSQKMPSILLFIINLKSYPHFLLIELLVLRSKGHTKPSIYIHMEIA